MDPIGLLGGLLVLGMLFGLLRVVIAGTGSSLLGSRRVSNRTAREIMLAVFAVANLVNSPSVESLNPAFIAITLVALVVVLGLWPLVGGGAIGIVGLLAAVADLELHQPSAVIPVALVALLAGVLFAETRVLARGIRR